MINVGSLSYGAGSVAFFALTALLLTVWRGRLQGWVLVFATFFSALWAAGLAYQASFDTLPRELIWSLEMARDICWILFLFKILSYTRAATGQLFGLARAGVLLLCVGLLGLQIGYPLLVASGLAGLVDVTIFSVGHVLIAVAGIVLVEQIYRNTLPEQRWAIKFLCLGLFGMFAYDLYMYSEALMFRVLDQSSWFARGAINALLVPLLAVSVARDPVVSANIFVSRGVIFHTTGLVAAGLYLLAMAAVGYYISYYGGSWGPVLQLIFLFGSLLVLVIVGFSGTLRARVKVFLNKHFFQHRYDYREEWLRLISTLSSSESGTPLYERVIRVIAEIVESPGGALWMRRESGVFAATTRWGIPAFEEHDLQSNAALIDYFEKKQWIIDLDEFRREPQMYAELAIPDWIAGIPRAWLVLPLMHHDELLAFVVLVEPRAPLALNWENIDLLKTVGRQAASYLAQNDAAEALADARQFEAFNRFSAFVIHDLKTLITQLSLVVRNAERHKDNPEFMDSVVDTVRHSVDKMNNLMQQLKGAMPSADVATVDMAKLLPDVVSGKASHRPKPELTSITQGLFVRGDRDKIATVIGHVIQNAVDATRKDGFVRVGLLGRDDWAVVEVTDNGIGMDTAFVKNRLFRPFDSTKGLTGMGIGAYESRELVRALGGDIKVSSESGKGSQFRIQFPLVKVELAAETKKQEVAG